MLKLLCSITAVAALALTASARTVDFKFAQNENPATVGKIVANRFADVPHPNFDENPDPPQEITYPETCAWMGALRFAEVTSDSALINRLEQRLIPVFGREMYLLPKPNHVDHNVFGTVPLLLYRFTGNPAYRELGLWYADTQWTLPKKASDNARRLNDKGFSWQTRYWIDDMFMVTAIQGQAYRTTHDPRYLDRAAAQMCSYLDSIQTPEGLFHHAAEAPFLWCRGNGWMAAGMTELLSLLPESHPDRPRIMEAYLKMMNRLADYQKQDGLWAQLIDDPEVWSETSGSAMFTFAMITGLKNGWLDQKKFKPIVEKAWHALVQQINSTGDIAGVCEGTNRTNDRDFYLHRRQLTGNMHGQAPILWCATAFLEPVSAR